MYQKREKGEEKGIAERMIIITVMIIIFVIITQILIMKMLILRTYNGSESNDGYIHNDMDYLMR